MILRELFWFFILVSVVSMVEASVLEVVYNKGVIRNFAKINRKTPVPETLFNKVASLGPATLRKMRLWHRYFPVKCLPLTVFPSLSDINTTLKIGISIT